MIQCSALSKPSHGTVSCNDERDVGSQCTYSCSEGYRPIGGSSRTCTLTGESATWSGTTPTCACKFVKGIIWHIVSTPNLMKFLLLVTSNKYAGKDLEIQTLKFGNKQKKNVTQMSLLILCLLKASQKKIVDLLIKRCIIQCVTKKVIYIQRPIVLK